MAKTKKKIVENPPQENLDFSSQQVKEEKPTKRAPRNTETQIKSIYENSTHQEIDLPRPAGRKTKFLTFTIFILAFLSAISWAGFFFFGQGQNFSEEAVKITIETAKEARTGEKLEFKIKIKNDGRENLANSTMVLRYPDEFVLTSAVPEPKEKEGREWDIGTITKNNTKEITVAGNILSQAGKQATFQVFFTYQPANLMAEFQKIVSQTVEIVSLPIDLTIETPVEAAYGEEFKLSITTTNNLDTEISGLELSITALENFKINLPANKQNKADVWILPTLAKGAATTTVVSIIPAGNGGGGQKTISVLLNLRKDNKSYLQKTAEKTINITKSNLILGITANNETEKQAVKFEDKITFAINAENSGDISLKNVTLRLTLDSPSTDNKSLFDWSKIEDKSDGDITGSQINKDVRRAIIIWNKNKIPALAEIKPKSKVALVFTLPLKNKTALDLTKFTNFTTNIFVEAIMDGGEEQTAIQSNTLNIILNSDLNISSGVTFKESKDLLVSPGVKNRYDTKSVNTVSWNITNSLHELTDLKLTAALPENVVWENVSTLSAGEITFDEITKQITWTLNRLPQSVNKATVSFDIGIQYAAKDEGSEATLLEKTRVEAIDKATGENILFFKESVLTML